MSPAAWVPSEHTVAAAALIAAVLLASLLVAKRDVWVSGMRAHRTLVRRTVIGIAVVAVAAFAAAHLDDVTNLIRRVEGGDAAWLAAGAAFEVASFGGYVVLTHVCTGPWRQA
jgi:hypothetical protein